MLPEKKLELLRIAGRIEIGYARDFSILLGKEEFTDDEKRLRELWNDGYMNKDTKNAKNVYYLSSKGLKQVETKMDRVYRVKGQSTDHELYVAEFAAFIHYKYKISNESFIFDVEMEGMKEFKPKRTFGNLKTKEKMDIVHAPDFIVGNRCYEVELNSKATAVMSKNYELNAKYFDYQVWLIYKSHKTLASRLKELALKHKCQTEIVYIEDLNLFMKKISDRNDRTMIKANEYGRKIDLKLKESKKPKQVWDELK